MTGTIKLFQIGLRGIVKDGMLLMLLPAPFLAGLAFKFGVPFIGKLLTEQLSFSMSPWYGLIDGLLICLTPMLTGMICSFLLLEECDDGIYAFFKITPAAGYSYLLARIGIPMAWSAVESVLVAALFHISALSFGDICCASLISAFSGLALTMMMVSFAGNRVEGLALSKLMSTISLLGLAAAWFVPSPYKYLAVFFPSYSIGEIMSRGANVENFFSGLLFCGIWICLFAKKFLRRID